jgi:sigma-E factor negative regulatory protein RseA
MNQSAERQQAPEFGPKGAIAALADGALDEHEAQIAIDLLLNSEELRAAWDELHWTGDCLRSEETGALLGRGDFMTRFHAELAAEPTVLAPAKTRAAPRRWLRYGVPATAAVMVSAVVWMAHPSGGSALVASDAAPAGTAVIVPVSAPVAARAVVDPAQLNEYLAAHQEFSATGLHGPGAIQAASFNIVADGGRDHP